MPIYEYQCQKCGLFEVTQKIIDKPLARCPQCKGKVKRLISNTSFQLKGTGWYITDYASKDKDKAPKSGKASGAEAKGDGKGDGASKTEPKSVEEKKPAKTASDSTT